MTTETDELGFDAPAPLGHPGRFGLLPDSSTGPEVGEILPSFSLPDQWGNLISFSDTSTPGRAIIIFYRSAVW